MSIWESGTTEEGKDQSWGYWKSDPGDLAEVHLGDVTGGWSLAGKTEFDPGDYTLMLDAGELRSFGPVNLVRTSRSVASFHVVH